MFQRTRHECIGNLILRSGGFRRLFCFALEPAEIQVMPWSLEIASSSDIDELMTWFPDAHSIDIWGGPKFRFPFDRETFREDCRWQKFSSYCVRSPQGEFSAFGQVGKRYKKSHLARLVTHPNMRRQGIGRKLLEMLIDEARESQDSKEVALFVYKDNKPAHQCYLRLGFEVQTYPAYAPMEDKCHYMARAVD